MKGVIQDDHIPLNKFELVVPGLPKFTFTTLSGLEEELDVVTMPDRTKRSGGRTQPVEFTMNLPMHHLAEEAVMELWFQESQDPVSPTYRKPATLLITSQSGKILRSFAFPDLFPGKRVIPDFDLDNEGEPAMTEWTFHASDMLPI